MKILTYLQRRQVGGISLAVASLIESAKKSKKKIDFVGVEIIPTQLGEKDYLAKTKEDNIVIYTICSNFKHIREVIGNVNSLREIKDCYQEVIDICQHIIEMEKPDIVLLEGTYYLPWCLLQASRNFNVSRVVHYHGILTKETANYEAKPRAIFTEMEKDFDFPDIFYIFPSELAKETVERDVFKKEIVHYVILPNPIPLYFFDVKRRNFAHNIGLITRWSWIKNPGFISKLARYNHRQKGEFVINTITDSGEEKEEIRKLKGIVNFFEPMDNENLKDFYSKMSVVISPSYFETYGCIAQEAIASGVPALISPNMGVREIYKKFGLEDWIVDFTSVSKVYDKLKEVSKQRVLPKIRQAMKEELQPSKIHHDFFQVLSHI